MNDPERLSTGNDAMLRAALRSTTNDGPSPEAIARLSGKLAVALPVGALAPKTTTPPTPAPVASASSAAAKVALAKLGAAFAIGAAVGAAGHAAVSTPAPVPVPVPTVTATAAATTATDTPTATASETPTTPPVVASSAPLPVPIHVPTTSTAAATASTPAASENELLDHAHDALLHHDAAKALALTDEHAKTYPKGVLAEERELLAIEALVALGRRDAANERAAAFRTTYPTSTYGARLDSILGMP